MLDLRLMLVTESGFEVPLVASPTQAARLLRSSGETDAADQRGDGEPGARGAGGCAILVPCRWISF